MARHAGAFKGDKRRKELSRQKKQEDKRQKRLNKNKETQNEPETMPSESADEGMKE